VCDVVLWNGSLAFLDDVIVGCWDFYEDGTGDELKGRSVTKDGAKSTDLSAISSQTYWLIQQNQEGHH
jgi:hypothetical protein